MDFVGDERGHVSVRFTKEALEGFVNLLDKTRIESQPGVLVRFSVIEVSPGEAEMVATTFLDEEPVAVKASRRPRGVVVPGQLKRGQGERVTR